MSTTGSEKPLQALRAERELTQAIGFELTEGPWAEHQGSTGTVDLEVLPEAETETGNPLLLTPPPWPRLPFIHQAGVQTPRCGLGHQDVLTR